MLRGTSVFRGCTIQARDGKAGHVSDVLFDESSWKIRWLVVDAGSWATERLVLIHPCDIGKTDGLVDRLYVELTKDQIVNSPDILHDPPVSRQTDGDLLTDEGGDPFWEGQGLMVASPAYAIANNQDPTLRSAREVSGYHVRAVDGAIGHLLELLIDDDAWTIRYLIIGMRNWWPGPHVMLAPLTVVEIDFWRRIVRLNITRDQVGNSPPAWEAPQENVPD